MIFQKKPFLVFHRRHFFYHVFYFFGEVLFFGRCFLSIFNDSGLKTVLDDKGYEKGRGTWRTQMGGFY